jgi:hypothetical protein
MERRVFVPVSTEYFDTATFQRLLSGLLDEE